MPPSNATASVPAHTTSAPPHAPTTEPSSSGTNTNPIIIGVSVGIAGLLFLIAAYKLWICITRRSRVPLPPKGPLAHQRHRQMAAYSTSSADYPQPTGIHPRDTPPFQGVSQFDDHARQAVFDDTSIPTTPSVVDSQAHLVQTPTDSDENLDPPTHPSFSSSTTARQHPPGYRQRRFSNSGSIHSSRSRPSSTHGTIRGRGPPHARHSRVDIVLPQPLAPGLYHGDSTRRHSQISSRERPPEDYPTTRRASVDGLPVSSQEMYGQDLALYPPPLPPLPTGYTPSVSPILPSPDAVSSAATFDPQPVPSPDRDSPSPVPGKGARSHRSRRRSEPIQQNQH